MIRSWYVAETGYLEVRGFSLASGMQQCSGERYEWPPPPLEISRYSPDPQILRPSDPTSVFESPDKFHPALAVDISLFRSNPIPCNRSHIYMNGTLREQPPTSDSAIITDCQWQPA